MVSDKNASSGAVLGEVVAAVRDVNFGYRPDSLVLRELTVEVMASEFLAVMGPSGCGKTTLLRMLAQQVAPERGEVVANYRGVGLVYQEDGLLPWLTVIENARLPLRFGKNSRDHLDPQAALAIVGASAFEGLHPHELSGGMKRRVELARILTSLSDVWLLDEPFEGLDFHSRRDLLSLVVTQAQERGIAVVLVTHSIDDVVTCANRVVVLNREGSLSSEIDLDGERPRDVTAADSLGPKRRLIEALDNG